MNLDAPTLDWTAPAAQALLDLLADAYSNQSDLAALALRAGIRPGHLPAPGPAFRMWRTLLPDLARAGRLRRLVELACDDQTRAAYQSRFVAVLEASRADVPAARPDARPFTTHLDRDQLQAVYAAGIQARLTRPTSFEALTGDMHPAYAASLPAAAGSVGWLTLLQAVNGVERLTTGEVPLRTVLGNAALLSTGTAAEAVFRQALSQVAP